VTTQRAQPSGDVGGADTGATALAALPVVALEQIRRFCARHRCPWEPTAWLDAVVGGLAVTVVERRTPANARRSSPTAAKRPVARLEYDHEHRAWSLHWRTSGDRWARYWPAPPSTDVAVVLEALDRDVDGVFWPHPAAPEVPEPHRVAAGSVAGTVPASFG